MTGSKMTTMTTDQMRAARLRGESETDRALLQQNKLAGIEPENDEDSPDATQLMKTIIENSRVDRLIGSGNKARSLG